MAFGAGEELRAGIEMKPIMGFLNIGFILAVNARPLITRGWDSSVSKSTDIGEWFLVKNVSRRSRGNSSKLPFAGLPGRWGVHGSDCFEVYFWSCS